VAVASVCAGFAAGGQARGLAPRWEMGSGSSKRDQHLQPTGLQAEDAKANIAMLPARLTKVAESLQELQSRLARAQRAVPTGEEFRQQVARGRREIEKLRGGLAERWKEVKRIAAARGVTLDDASLRNVVPEALKDFPEFITARERAVDATKRVAELEERLIKMMLITTYGEPTPAPPALPDAGAIALEWANLAANQKSYSASVQIARTKASAAKVEFDPRDLANPANAPATESYRPFIEARERAAAQLAGREATAELVATLEFLKAVGPLREKW
jgi:hypothetical protein